MRTFPFAGRVFAFARPIIASAIGAFGLGAAPLPAPAADAGLSAKLVIVGRAGTHAVEGAEQGITEAEQQGEFLGQRFELATVATPDDVPATGIAAILATGPQAEAAALARRFPKVPVLNLAAGDDALRAACIPNLLHVMPSASMRRDAIAQWRQHHPEANVEALAWHPAFDKYAASQLNLRFEKRFKQPMDDAAWAGWAGVKLVTDSIARIQQTDPAALLDALKTKLAFDGQKGSTLSFRPNGQLRQPLLISDGPKILGEAPVRGVADPDELDSLGDSKCAP